MFAVVFYENGQLFVLMQTSLCCASLLLMETIYIQTRLLQCGCRAVSFLALTGLLLCSGCEPGGRLTDERNPFYARGTRLRQQGDYDGAVAAFEQCLRASPQSAKAHLQLAMLYEDQTDEPIYALFHYQRYLALKPDGEYADVAAESIDRVKQRCFGRLRDQLPATPEENAQITTPPEVAARLAQLEKQKEFLLTRLREMTRELIELRGAERSAAPAVTAGTADATAEPPVAGGSTTPTPAPTDEQVHLVRKGDTLSDLAQQYYGSTKYWTQLRDYNSDVLHGSDLLLPGMKLQLPPKEQLQ